MVVDQVCLVPDVPAFLEAIASWDERYFFPILIDEPAWTLPFLRAFRPARVVRYVRRASPWHLSPRPRRTPAGWSRQSPGHERSRPCLEPGQADPRSPARCRTPVCRPVALGVTPPGMVLSAPEAPMLAGAVALAAGRFQPLVRLPADE